MGQTENEACRKGDNKTRAFTFPRLLSGERKPASPGCDKKNSITAADVAGIALSTPQRRRSSINPQGVYAEPTAEEKRDPDGRRERISVRVACAFMLCAAVIALAVYAFGSAYLHGA